MAPMARGRRGFDDEEDGWEERIYSEPDAFRVDARIILWRGDNVLRVPVSALFREHGRWAVYVVRDGRAHLRAVDVGHRGRVDVEITRGLQPGDRVIVHPSDQIEDTTRVVARSTAAVD